MLCGAGAVGSFYLIHTMDVRPALARTHACARTHARARAHVCVRVCVHARACVCQMCACARACVQAPLAQSYLFAASTSFNAAVARVSLLSPHGRPRRQAAPNGATCSREEAGAASARSLASTCEELWVTAAAPTGARSPRRH
jgi:hypothetical protein